MGIPFFQQYRVSRYVIGQKFRRRQRYPLVLMLEPLFRCNLACAGCGKIDYPEEILNRRLDVDECLSAIDECGAPIVCITGGEPLLHRDMPQIVAGFVRRKKFVYLGTNGLLLKAHIKDYTPSPYLTITIHLDGNRRRHDALAGKQGVHARAVQAIRHARAKGFRVTINSTLYSSVTAQEMAAFFDSLMNLGVNGITISPGFGYARARQKEVFLKRTQSQQIFRDLFKLSSGHKWNFTHTGLFLDFLAGNQPYQCTPWGNPTRNIFGWQRPCYLLVGEGYAPSFEALMEETDWESYGRDRNPKCENCMMHCGFEATAVNDTLEHPLKALGVYLRGPATEGSMAPWLRNF